MRAQKIGVSFHMTFSLFNVSMLIACSLSAIAQTPASIGYTLPEPLPIAPGQIALLTTTGIAHRTPDKAFVSIPETELDGIRAFLQQQGVNQAAVKLMGFVQSGCAEADLACIPTTHLTVSIPLEIQPDSSPLELVINDRGKDLPGIAVKRVNDAIHILNTCDAVAVFLSVSSGLGPNCQSIITHSNGRVVTIESPAKPGETLVAWAYGLGLPGGPGNGIKLANAPELFYDFHFNSGGKRPPGQVGQKPAYAAPIGSWGLYQMNIVLPQAPEGVSISPCDGKGIRSSATINFIGLNSQDSAGVCLTP